MAEALAAAMALGMVLVHALALVEWNRIEPGETAAMRRPSLTWTAAALLLVLMMLAIQVFAFGARTGMASFNAAGGPLLLLQGALVLILVQTGQYWAGRCGARPFRPFLRRWRRWPWRWLAAALAAMLAWTLLLARLVPHEAAGGQLLQWMGLDAMPSWLAVATTIALLTLAPILEEVLYRHYLLYRLGAWFGRGPGRGAAPAILLTSTLFAVAHVGHLEPLWLKWAQIFVPGLLLGATAWLHGLEAAIALHWGFNLALLGGAALLA